VWRKRAYFQIPVTCELGASKACQCGAFWRMWFSQYLKKGMNTLIGFLSEAVKEKTKHMEGKLRKSSDLSKGLLCNLCSLSTNGLGF